MGDFAKQLKSGKISYEDIPHFSVLPLNLMPAIAHWRVENRKVVVMQDASTDMKDTR